MQETIIFAPGANGTELLRTMAKFGKNTLNTRVMNALDLAKDALMRSGIVIEEEFLPRSEESSVIDSFLSDIKYFAAASYSDSVNLADALYSLRSFILENEAEYINGEFISKAEFTDKNTAIAEAYGIYCEHLKNKKQIDTVGLIRKAINEAKPYTNISFLLFEEFPMNPLEEQLAKTLFGELPEAVSFSKILNHFESPLFTYTEAYGGGNEVEAVIGHIFKNNIPIDKCTVAVAEAGKYAQLFYDFSAEHDIPTTFGCGVPITAANPAKLLKSLFIWNNDGFNGIDALLDVLFNESFNLNKFRELFDGKLNNRSDIKKLAEIAGNLKLGFNDFANQKLIGAYKGSLDADDKEKLEFAENLDILSREFLALGYDGIVENYSIIRSEHPGRIDAAALKNITAAIKNYKFYSGISKEEKIEKRIEKIMGSSVCTENGKEGMLHITSIGGAISTIRPYLFVVGLSADNFPGKPTENYLILDSDYDLLDEADKAPTSKNRINKKKETLRMLLEDAKTLGVKVNLSYSSYEPATLKNSNPSSVLFDIYRDENGQDIKNEDFKKAFSKVSYFTEDILPEREIGRAYISGKNIVKSNDNEEDLPESQGEKVDYSNLEFSPSAIEDYFSCPHHFYLTRILGIKETEENDPFEIIAPKDLGKLVHRLMETDVKKISEKEFLEKAEYEFGYYLKSKPPVSTKGAEREKNNFLRMMKHAYEMEIEKNNEIAGTEVDLRATHPTGIKLSGRADRIEKTVDGTYIIADFKTGRRVRHEENDIDSCIQVAIYAFMAEENGMPVSKGEYRYLRDKQIIKLDYDEAMKIRLSDKIQEFKSGLDNNFFEAEECDACRYCKLKNVCAKNKTRANEEE